MPHLVRSIRAGNTVNRPGRRYTKRLNRAARAQGFQNHAHLVQVLRLRFELALAAGTRF